MSHPGDNASIKPPHDIKVYSLVEIPVVHKNPAYHNPACSRCISLQCHQTHVLVWEMDIKSFV